jgi:hypothetical protein
MAPAAFEVMRVRTLLAPLALAAAFPLAASAGVVKGHVFMGARAAAAASANQRSLARLQAESADAVVYVERVPDKVERKLADARTGWLFRRRHPRLPRMVQMDRRFKPRVMAIARGGELELVNLDRTYHSTFSVSPARRFDLGKRAPGAVDTMRFERTGVVNLHCEIHPDMLGFVVVVPNHAFARPDSLGAFRLPALPQGRYRLHAWHPRHRELVRDFEMPRRGDVELSLVF